MRKQIVALVAVLALSLGGCSTLQAISQGLGTVAGFQVTQDEVDAAKAGYIAGVLAWASGYRDLYDANPCRTGTHATLTNPCAEYPVVLQLQQADNVVDGALKTAQAGVTSCRADPSSAGCRGAPAAYQALRSAIDTVKGIARVYGYGGS